VSKWYVEIHVKSARVSEFSNNEYTLCCDIKRMMTCCPIRKVCSSNKIDVVSVLKYVSVEEIKYIMSRFIKFA
jgi:hypothetical protein